MGSRGVWQGGLRGPSGRAAQKPRAADGRGAARLAESFLVPLFEHV
jgi:hypothetical protein